MIKSDKNLAELFNEDSQAVKVFMEYGLKCPSCRGVEQDTVKWAAINNGLDLAEFLKSLNASKK